MARPEPRRIVDPSLSAAIAPPSPQSMFAGWRTLTPPPNPQTLCLRRRALNALARQIADNTGADFRLVLADIGTMPADFAPTLDSAGGWCKLAAFVGAPDVFPSTGVH